MAGSAGAGADRELQARLWPAHHPLHCKDNTQDNVRCSGNARRHKMALPIPPGLTPSEVGFLCELELVTVIPRQRLEGLELLGVGNKTP